MLCYDCSHGKIYCGECDLKEYLMHNDSCLDCYGDGYIGDGRTKCPKCDGSGRKVEKVKIDKKSLITLLALTHCLENLHVQIEDFISEEMRIRIAETLNANYPELTDDLNAIEEVKTLINEYMKML